MVARDPPKVKVESSSLSSGDISFGLRCSEVTFDRRFSNLAIPAMFECRYCSRVLFKQDQNLERLVLFDYQLYR
jgi:hypothetical protein